MPKPKPGIRIIKKAKPKRQAVVIRDWPGRIANMLEATKPRSGRQSVSVSLARCGRR